MCLPHALEKHWLKGCCVCANDHFVALSFRFVRAFTFEFYTKPRRNPFLNTNLKPFPPKVISRMKISSTFVVIILLFFTISCEDKIELDTTPPTVLIVEPTPNKTISGLVTIKVSSEDNKGIHKIDFFIDSQYVASDSLVPYEYEWDTSEEINGEHEIKVNSYDLESNMTESELVKVYVDNTIRFNKTFGNIQNDEGRSVQQTTDGGYIIAGYADLSTRDAWLIKTDSQGNEEWNKLWEYCCYDQIFSIHQSLLFQVLDG